jgi:hypothetical protein
MIINNLNCTVVNYVPQHKRNNNIFTVLSVTIQKVAILDDSICDTYCMCYGSYVKYLHVFYPSKLVDSVTKKKYVFEGCHKSNIVYFKALKLIETVEI